LHPDYDGMPPKLEMSTKKTNWYPGTLPGCPLIPQYDPWTSLASNEVYASEELGRPSGNRWEGSRVFQSRIPRPPIPGLLTRPRVVVATLAGSPSTSASTHAPPFDMMEEALVAAAEYGQCEGNTSMMSGPSSDVSFPSRGWASVAASVQGDPASAVMARARGFHVCFRRDHFTMQRTQQIQQDRGVLPGRVSPPAPSPSATSFTSGVATFTGGVAPVSRPAPQFPRSAYIPTPTWGPNPRYANSGRSHPATVTVKPVQPIAEVPEEPTSMVTPTSENFVGDV
jgi:hypothetical protein